MSWRLPHPTQIVTTELLPTTLVSSYPQPDWRTDRQKPAGRFPPRVRVNELWRVAPEWLLVLT